MRTLTSTLIRRVSPVRATIVLIAVLGCGKDEEPPLGPEAAPDGALTAVTGTTPLAFRQVSAGNLLTCAVATDDRAYCWGANWSGELGIGTLFEPERCFDDGWCSVRPIAVLGGLHFKAVSAGVNYACGVTTDARAYCWGFGGYGQLGDGTLADHYAPVRVGGALQWRQVSAGSTRTCGVTTENRAYCWGDGQPRPTELPGGRTFRQVSASSNHSCGVTTSKETYCWLGNTLKPFRVSTAQEFIKIDTGFDYTCAVTALEQAFCWGWTNDAGQLGDGTTIARALPRAVAGGLAFERVTAGSSHTCGEAPGNRAYCWGGGGLLGDGTTTQRLKPVAVAGDQRFTQLSAGVDHTCGVTTASLVYCWGGNYGGQLGNGTRTASLRPTPVVGP